MNAIQHEITANILANQIRLERAQKSTLTIILVEGGSDARLFGRFIDRSRASISICFDRGKLYSVLNRLEQVGFAGVVGIVDPDFDRILGLAPPSSNICWTDNNDAEGMLLPSILEKFLDEYGSAIKIEADRATSGLSPLEILVEEASKLGAIRLVNKIDSLGLKFDDMDYKFVSNVRLEIDIPASILHIIQRSINNYDPTVLRGRVDAVHNQYGAQLHLCQGHDLIRLLGRGLRQRWAATGEFDSTKKAEALEKIVRVSYEEEAFLSSGLYGCLCNWEINNQSWRIF